MFDLVTLKMIGQFPLQDVTTVVRAFDQTPDTFYFGIRNLENSAFAIRVMTQNDAIVAMNAHNMEVTSLEQTNINN